MDASDEGKIVQSVLSGDKESYADLVREHQEKIRRVCLLILRNPAEADDAAQDVFVKAYESLSRFRGQSSFATWLYRIAHNHCMDMLRQKTRRKTDSWDALLENHPEGSPALPSTSEKNPVSEEDRELVSNVLSSLRREHREILMLREVGGFTYDEIASSLECSLDAVKARLRRARLEMMEKARHFLGSKIV